MTPAQRKVRRESFDRLREEFRRAQQASLRPGGAQRWMLPFLAAVLEEFYRLRRTIVDGTSVAKAIARGSKRALRKIIGKVTNRDAKTVSRWAIVLNRAYRSKVRPEDLSEWLKTGGGISGRARAASIIV